jgi:NodT family efflux transporter outer membrane factor (OMF) lipoprotein
MRKIYLLLSVLVVTGCNLGPGPVQPKITMPAAFDGKADPAATTWPAADWWKSFGSAELDRLVIEAQANNLDIAAAAARVMQAEAQLRVSGASLFPSLTFTSNARQRGPAGDPQLIEGGGSGSRSNLNSDLGGGSSSSRQRSSVDAGLSAQYELDFWGKNQDNVDSAKASLRASHFDRDTVALTVTTGVASTYLQIMVLRDRIALAQQNLGNAQSVLKVVDSKARNGAVSALDPAQQKSQVAAQQAAIPPLQLQEKQAMNALALLLGRNPEQFHLIGAGMKGLILPTIGAGLPSGLLTRRPDIQEAEANLKSANANLMAARAAMLPTIDLSASLTLEGIATNFAFAGAGAAYSALASLTQPIFDAGALKGQRDVAAGKQLELVQTYHSTILTALSDTENALASIDSLKSQQQFQEAEVAESSTAYEIAQSQYRAGSSELLPVLDAQRTVFQAQDGRLTILLSQFQAAVSLYKALGGGWQVGPEMAVASTTP